MRSSRYQQTLFDHGTGDDSDFTGSHDERVQQVKGAPFAPMSHQKTWEKAIVQGVYPDRHSCDVYTERGKFLSGVRWPDQGRRAPQRGEELIVHFQMGNPVLETIKVNTEVPGTDTETNRITPKDNVGGESAFYQGKGSGNFRGKKPRDVLPGDHIIDGDMGNLIGVLSGGSVIVKASDLAQVIATQARHLLRLVGKNLKIDTGAGTLDFETEDGKSTISLYAGADEETESSPTAENFRIRCELGADGELVDFRVTDGRGRSRYRLHVDPDGRVQTKSRRKTEVIREDRRTEVGTDDDTLVGGNASHSVEGDETRVVGGTFDAEAGGNWNMRAASDASMTAMNDLIFGAARNVEMAATGSVTGSSPAMNFDVSNGDMKIDIGNPLNGDAQTRSSGLDIDTFNGDIDFRSAFGNVKINTTLPGSVKLGGPGPGVFSAMLYETFEAFMSIFGVMLDTHVHPIPQFGGAPTLPPLIPPYLTTKGALSLCKSNFVKLGG